MTQELSAISHSVVVASIDTLTLL